MCVTLEGIYKLAHLVFIITLWGRNDCPFPIHEEMLRGVMYLALGHETSKGIVGLEDTYVSKAPDLFLIVLYSGKRRRVVQKWGWFTKILMHLIQPASSGPTGSHAYCLSGEFLVSSTTIESHVWHKPGACLVFVKSWLCPRADPAVAIVVPRLLEAILNSALSVCHHSDHHLCISFLPRQTGPSFASSWDLGRVCYLR